MAAVKGGFKVFGLANHTNPKELENEGAIVFQSFHELAFLLEMNN